MTHLSCTAPPRKVTGREVQERQLLAEVQGVESLALHTFWPSVWAEPGRGLSVWPFVVGRNFGRVGYHV